MAMPRLFSLAFLFLGLIMDATEGGFPQSQWPIINCYAENIDVVLVADSSNRTIRKQTRFLSKIVDVFSPSTETDLGRLRVALAVTGKNPALPYNLKTLIAFDQVVNKADLRSQITRSRYEHQTDDAAYPPFVFTRDGFTRNSLRQRTITVLIATLNPPPSDQWLFLGSLPNDTLPPFIFVLGDGGDVPENAVRSVRGQIKFTDLNNLDVPRDVSPLLCQPCRRDWFPYKPERVNLPTDVVSCYKLIEEVNDPILWMEANKLCAGENTELVSIETKEELNFLRREVLRRKPNPPPEGWNVMIGLRRDDATKGRRFRWVSKMPLVHSHWKAQHLQAGPTAGCVIWKFENCDAENLVSSNQSDVRSRDEVIANMSSPLAPDEPQSYCLRPENGNARLDYWVSVRCGENVGNMFLCESNLKLSKWRPYFSYHGELELKKPDQGSISAAIARGRLVYTENMTSFKAITVAPRTSEINLLINESLSLNIQADAIPVFSCLKLEEKILYNYVCDFNAECRGRFDEVDCHHPMCMFGDELFHCRSEQCIPKDLVCDLYNDCLDGDDEDACLHCPHARCQDGRCLPMHWFGDGEVDCDSCSDYNISVEMTYAEDPRISECVFTCNRTQCVYASMLNDGVVDCLGPEGPIDETIGALENTTCYESGSVGIDYSNWAPKCVYIKDRYGEILGCRNMKHLENCEVFDCPAGFLKCPGSYCIPTYYVHNFIADCPNGEDESAYAEIDCSGYFICEMDTLPNVCLHPNFVCDGHKHCPGGDDEVNCNLTCSPGFICLGGVVIVTPAATELDINLVGPETRYFDTSGLDASNVFTDFPFHLFQNVITAKFSGCNISNVTAHFNMSSVLNSLRSLDLSGNMIEEVASENIFKRMLGLETLSLSRNFNLVTLARDAFSLYPFYKSTIEHLDLSFTGIQEIQSQFFRPLSCLKTLNVSNTPLVMTQFGLLTSLIKLDVLDLRGINDVTARPDMFKGVIVKRQLFVDSFKLCCPQLHNENTLIEGCHFVKDPFSSCSDLMSSSVLRVFLWVNGFLALLGNAAVIAYRFIFDKRTLRMGYGQFVTHLGFSDMLMGVYLIMIAAADTGYRGSYLFEEFAWRNSTACKVAGFISTLSCELSTFFIFLITLDRFLVIRFPFGKFRLHGRGVVLLCILSWATGTFMAAVPGMQFFGDWSVYTSTGVCVGLPLIPRSDVGWLFAQSLFIYVNFFLFTLIAIGQIVIYRTMVVMSIASSALTNASSRRAQDLTVAKHLSLVVVTNFLCWFPIGVQGLMTLGGFYLGLDAYAWTVVFVLPINSAINPILYTAPAVFRKSCEIKESASRYLTHSKPS